MEAGVERRRSGVASEPAQTAKMAEEFTESGADTARQQEVARALADLEGRTLGEKSGYFDRLIYLASLRDYNTGRYHHYGLEARHSPQAVDEALHQSHIRTFEELMALSLEDQTRDLIGLFESLREDRSRLITTWQHLRSYQVLPPDRCHPLARELFDKNIQVMLRILRETDLWALLNQPHGDPDNLP
jgi:hypothetical protein